jgi:hypothetical protein
MEGISSGSLNHTGSVGPSLACLVLKEEVIISFPWANRPKGRGPALHVGLQEVERVISYGASPHSTTNLNLQRSACELAV